MQHNGIDAIPKLAKDKCGTSGGADPLAGTYTVQWDAVYEDGNSPRTGAISQPFVKLVDQQIVVQHATPTVGLYTLVGGQDYMANPTLITDGYSGETPQQWTISWGDGQSNISYNPYANFSHHYQRPGNYSVNASVITNEGAYSATATAAIAGATPTVSIIETGGGVAYENPAQGTTYDKFVITRSASSSLPLTVGFTLGGTATPNEYELTDSAGDILTNSVTIPANTTLCTVYVSALEDWTPAWTDTLAMTLGPSPVYAVSPTYYTASTEIVNDDVGITLGGGSGNMILQGSATGQRHLVPLYLTVPSELKTGATVSLIANSALGTAQRVDVWTTATPGSTTQPIIGKTSGGTVGSTTWTVGTDTVPTTLWVGAFDGSTDLGDIQFTLSASDAAATPAPAHPSTMSASTKPATAMYLSIKMYNDPNSSGDLKRDIAGQTHDYLVGQLVDLEAKLTGPAKLTRLVYYAWDVPGEVAHNIEEHEDASSRTLIPLLARNGPGLVPGDQHIDIPTAGASAALQTGFELRDINFFWISTTNPVDEDAISVSAKNAVKGAPAYAESTTFNVYTPASTATATPGTPSIYQTDPTRDAWKFGPGQITFSATVTTRGGFGPGEFRFLQEILPAESALRTDGNTYTFGLVRPGAPSGWGLDTWDPYPANLNGFDFDNLNISWDTDRGIRKTSDRPDEPISDSREQSMTLNNTFKTFLMYRPPGGGSQFVPLESVMWYQGPITATQVPARSGKWSVSGTPSAGTFQPETSEPEWAFKYDHNLMDWIRI